MQDSDQDQFIGKPAEKAKATIKVGNGFDALLGAISRSSAARCGNLPHRYTGSMAQSIRISDEFYELTQAVSSSSGRSLAQPLEYWARLGARVDLGITAAQTLALLNEQPRSSALMSEAIAARHAKDAADVERGHRHATSLIVMPKAIVQSAKLGFPKDAFGTVRAW